MEIRNKSRPVLVQYGTQHLIAKIKDDSVFYGTGGNPRLSTGAKLTFWA